MIQRRSSGYLVDDSSRFRDSFHFHVYVFCYASKCVTNSIHFEPFSCFDRESLNHLMVKDDSCSAGSCTFFCFTWILTNIWLSYTLTRTGCHGRHGSLCCTSNLGLLAFLGCPPSSIVGTRVIYVCLIVLLDNNHCKKIQGLMCFIFYSNTTAYFL